MPTNEKRKWDWSLLLFFVGATIATAVAGRIGIFETVILALLGASISMIIVLWNHPL